MSNLARLRNDLKQTKANYRTQKKELRNYYCSDRKTIKLRFKEDCKNTKALIKDAKKQPVVQDEPSRFSRTVDSITLGICAPFERKASNVRYRQRDPDGYEADLVIQDTVKLVEYYEKRLTKGKDLKSRDLEMLTKLRMTTDVIVTKELGCKGDLAAKLSERICNIIPLSPDQFKSAHNMMDKFQGMIDGLTPQSVST